jgi:hypothetical protein
MRRSSRGAGLALLDEAGRVVRSASALALDEDERQDDSPEVDRGKDPIRDQQLRPPRADRPGDQPEDLRPLCHRIVGPRAPRLT